MPNSALNSLRSKIVETAKEQNYWGELIPAKWITLEDALFKLKEDGCKVIKKRKITALSSKLPIPMESLEELELFLNFHHESGNLIYFGKDDDLKKTVVLDPQWLIDAFKCIISSKMFCSRKGELLKLWMEFDSSAILRQTLIDALWKRDNSFKDHVPLLLQYLEKLGLLAKPRLPNAEIQHQAVDYYFAPSVLKEKPPPEIQNYSSGNGTSTGKLFFTTPSLFVPTAVFNKLLAVCIRKFTLAKHKKKGMIYCGCGVFSLRNNHRLYLHFYDSVIQVWITKYSYSKQEPEVSLCREIKDFIQIFLENELHRIFSYVQCPHGKQFRNLNDLVQPEQPEEVLCDCHCVPDVLETKQLTKYWCNEDQDAETRMLTDKDLNKIANHIGEEFNSLGLQLGLSQAEIDHCKMDHSSAVNIITAMLIKWRDTKSVKGTFQELKSAMISVHCDVAGAFASIQRRET